MLGSFVIQQEITNTLSFVLLQIGEIVLTFNEEGKSLCQRMWQVRTGKSIPQEPMFT